MEGLIMGTTDGIPIHQVVDAQRLYGSDLRHFETQPSSELERLLRAAEQAIDSHQEPFREPDVVCALVDVASRRGVDVPKSVGTYVDAMTLQGSPEPPCR